MAAADRLTPDQYLAVLQAALHEARYVEECVSWWRWRRKREVRLYRMMAERRIEAFSESYKQAALAVL